MYARALMALIVAGGLGTTGCTRKNPVSCADGYCEDPALPFCDVDGALEGNAMTCIAVECTPGAVAGCRADQAIVCNNAGDNYDLSHCDNGCDEATGCIAKSCVPNTVRCGDRVVEQCDANGVLHTSACDQACISDPTPHCSYISPQYLPNVCDTEATEPAREILGQVTIDTTQAANCNGGLVTQGVGRPICVLRYKEATVKSGATLSVVGMNPIAIVTDGALRVTGVVDASAPAHSRAGGPGAAGGNGGQAASNKGGGGAGFATSGAAGGGANTGTGGSGGISNAQDGLFGGNNGSSSGLSDVYVGGGGGGAVALISCQGQVLVDGSVNAGGAGGQGGHIHTGLTSSFAVGGGGGGSGGTIVLQGLNVVVSGTLNANGGGGGCGKPSAGAVGVDGSDGKSSIAPPAACTPSSNEGAGGSGGAAALAPQPGGGATVGTPGGGGGSVGFIRTFTPSTVIPSVNPTRVSPAVQPNMNVPVR